MRGRHSLRSVLPLYQQLLTATDGEQAFFAFPNTSLTVRSLDKAGKVLYGADVRGHDHRRGSYSAACAIGVPVDVLAREYGWASDAHRVYFRHLRPTAACFLFHGHRLPAAARPAAAILDGTGFSLL